MSAPQIKYSALEAMALIACNAQPEHIESVFLKAAEILAEKPDYCWEEIEFFISEVIPALEAAWQAEDAAGYAACEVAATISRFKKARTAHYIDIDLRHGGEA